MTFNTGIIADAVMYFHCPDCAAERHLTPFEIGVSQDGGTLILACLIHEHEIGRFALENPIAVTCNCGQHHGTSPVTH